MKYMLLMNVPSGGTYQIFSWDPQDIRAHMAFMQGCAARLRDAGELVAVEALTAPDQAQHVRAGNDGQALTDGMFPETKEFLAGYWIVDVDSPERARTIAAEISGAPGPGRVPLRMVIEVRQLMTIPCTCRCAQPGRELALNQAGGEQAAGEEEKQTSLT